MTRVRCFQLAIAGVLLAGWEILPRLGLIDPVFVPCPSRILTTLGEIWSSGHLGEHTRISAIRALGGLGVGMVVGPLLGIALGGWFPKLEQALEPLLGLASQANPVVLFHVVLLFLGIGESAKVVVIAWLAVWPIAFGMSSGIRQTDPALLRVARSFNLSRWALLVRVILPGAAPSLFTGIRLSAGYAFIMLIAAEMMGTSSGLGWFVVQSQENYHAGRIFAASLVITSLAMLTDGALALIERRAIRWRPPSDPGRAMLGAATSGVAAIDCGPAPVRASTEHGTQPTSRASRSSRWVSRAF